MSLRQKTVFIFLLALLVTSVASFFAWWFKPEHYIDFGRTLVSSLLLAWSVLLPFYFYFFALRAKKPNPGLEVPYFKTAIVVTKAPSEPFEVVKKTLQGMIAQKYPHDNWLADEDPSVETVRWCRENGVYISTRKYSPEYHNNS